MWPLGFPERGRKGRQVFHNQIMVHTHVALVLQMSTTADSICDAQEIVVRKRKWEREKKDILLFSNGEKVPGSFWNSVSYLNSHEEM